MNLSNIKILLQDISQFEILEIIDNSAKHKGHAGVKNTSTILTHVELRILNKNNLSKIDIHRTIHEKLNLAFKSGLHSLEIKISNR
tara:strand:- start:4 stop:261 length:258 start_codon:yes stop_codon:yes gene_type:complete